MDQKIDEIIRELRELKAIVTETNAKIDPLKEKIEELESICTQTTHEVQKVQEISWNTAKRMDILEQYSRRENVIINGIPKKDNENVREIVKKVAEKLKVPLYDYSIISAHRLPSKQNTYPIVAKLLDRDVKTALVKASKKEKINSGLLNYETVQPIYCDDHLTYGTRSILNTAKKLRENNIIKFVWIRNCNVYIRENENSKAIIIRSLEQLEDWHPPSFLQKSTENKELEVETDPSLNQKKRTLEIRSPENESHEQNPRKIKTSKNLPDKARPTQNTLSSFQFTRATTRNVQTSKNN